LLSFLGGAGGAAAGFLGASAGLAAGLGAGAGFSAAGLAAAGGFGVLAGLAASSPEFESVCDGGGVDFFGGGAALFASLAVPGLGLAFALLFTGGFTRLGGSAPLGFAAALRAGGAAAALAGLAAGAFAAGFAATVRRTAGLILVFGRAFGLVAGLYAAAVKGAEWPTGIAFGDGAIFVTTGWLASAAGGRAEAAAARAGPLTLSAVGATGFADITFGLEISSADTFTDAAATGRPPWNAACGTAVTAPGAAWLE
jgi:hypothetical protein